MASSRKESYKKTYKATQDIRDEVKISIKENRIKVREEILLKKRLKVGFHLEVEPVQASRSEWEENNLVLCAIKTLKKGEKLKALSTLQKLFASHPSNADVFVKNDGLQSLHSCFKFSDVEILHYSAWCVINLAATVSPCYSSTLLGLAPSLIQFLQGSDMHMQELCAWALANLAGEGMASSDILHAQGCTHVLLEQFKKIAEDSCTKEDVAKSLLFGLINLARGSSQCVQYMHENAAHYLIKNLVEIVPLESPLNMEIGWFAFYMYSRKMSQSQDSQVIPLICNRLNGLVEADVVSCIERGALPLVCCLCKFLSSRPISARLIFDNAKSFHCIAKLLEFGSKSIRRAVCTLIRHAMVDVSSRVLITLNPLILAQILTCCSSQDTGLVFKALQTIDFMTKTSCYVDSYLIDQGVLKVLLQTLDSVTASNEMENLESIVKLAVSIFNDIMLSQPDLTKHYLERNTRQNTAEFIKFLNLSSSTSNNHLVELLKQFINPYCFT